MTGDQIVDNAKNNPPARPLTEAATASAVDYAILSAQDQGKVTLDQMIFIVDRAVAQRRASMRAHLQTYGESDDFDLAAWGRSVHVLESLLAFLVRLNGDDELKREIKRRLKGEGKDGKGVGRGVAQDPQTDGGPAQGG